MKCNKAQFKRQKFSCNELTTHLGQPKDIGLTVDLSIEHFQRENALLIFYEILPTGS